VAEGFPLPLF